MPWDRLEFCLLARFESLSLVPRVVDGWDDPKVAVGVPHNPVLRTGPVHEESNALFSECAHFTILQIMSVLRRQPHGCARNFTGVADDCKAGHGILEGPVVLCWARQLMLAFGTSQRQISRAMRLKLLRKTRRSAHNGLGRLGDLKPKSRLSTRDSRHECPAATAQHEWARLSRSFTVHTKERVRSIPAPGWLPMILVAHP
jgi:hypothetical protein